MKLYIYNPENNEHIATIIGDSNEACERVAAERYGSGDGFAWTYSPAFGTADGLVENTSAEEIEA